MSLAAVATTSGSERCAEILRAARRLLDENGPEGLTMRRLGDAVGIQPPSVYKHFTDKSAVEQALIAEGMAELGRLVKLWRDERGGDLARIARGYRRFALEHRHLYRLMTERELDRNSLLPEPGEGSAALSGLAGSPDRARAAWAFIHGMVQLELAGRFAPEADLEAAWEAGLGAFEAAGKA
jgi:AcrR family transcriptional regulator